MCTYTSSYAVSYFIPRISLPCIIVDSMITTFLQLECYCATTCITNLMFAYLGSTMLWGLLAKLEELSYNSINYITIPTYAVGYRLVLTMIYTCNIFFHSLQMIKAYKTIKHVNMMHGNHCLLLVAVLYAMVIPVV